MNGNRGLFRGERITEALGVYLPATALCRLVGMGRNILLTWLMFNQAEFGLLALALVVINLLHPLCSLGLNEAVTRYTPLYETRHMLRGFLWRAVLLVSSVAAATTFILIEVSPTVGRALFESFTAKSHISPAYSSHYLGLMQNVAYTCFTLVIYFLALCVLKGLRMFRAISLMELVGGLVFTALAVIVVVTGHGTAVAVVSCYMMSMWVALACFALPALLAIVTREEDARPVDDEPIIRRMFAFSLWAAAAAFTWNAMQHYPLWYLNRTHGSNATGVFGAIRTLTQYVSVASVAVVTVVMTAVTKIWESQGREPADRLLALMFKLTSLVLLTCCVLMSVFRQEIVLLFAPSYRQGAAVIPLSLLSFLIIGNLSFLSVHFALIEKTRFLFWPWAIGLACNVLCGLWLVGGGAGRTSSGGLTGPIGAVLRPLVNCGAGDGIGAAAWAGALGLVGATVTCLVLLSIERRPVDRGSYILIVAGTMLIVRIGVMIPIAVVLWILAWRTTLIFSADEKELLAKKASSAMAWLRGRRAGA